MEAAEILVAVNRTGEARIVYTEASAHQAVLDGFTLYGARDMYMYVTGPNFSTKPSRTRRKLPKEPFHEARSA